MKPLIIIPARGGSKGIPGKNIKPLAGKPLIYYTIDAAREIADDNCICVSTDDLEIKQSVEDYGLKIPFLRPDKLATDSAATNDVVKHAMQYYDIQGFSYDVVILLQPTSPFRTGEDIRKALKLYDPSVDMVVSVSPAKSNPYYTCMEEDSEGLLHISKGDGTYTRRQDCPEVYELNGAIYIINPESIRLSSMSEFTRRRKYLMDAERSIDLDSPLDWQMAELMIENKIIEL